ncbi:hypothetical protein PRK78_003258 [Emydomyces testavorans]|uniref:Transcription factor Iwr1 domain-containing protein n=1 Tax=Emydomyces testavorans TaxID=2070801 RepID=A0AAF0IIL3_9EURO|nr:hypothetical protein PRK78_003258 [Emydomyces testavorans]
MALPPEQIRIKRRREEEPVETLLVQEKPALGDIQSETRETKRRFTDFVFQRVVPEQDEVDIDSTLGPAGEKDESAGSHVPPDSVSLTVSGPSVPIVKPTAPGAELTETCQLATTKKKAHGTRGMAALIKSHPRTTVTKIPSRSSSSTNTKASIHSGVRRFHIAAPASDDQVLHKVGGGVQKKKGLKHAVVVEQKGDVLKSISTLSKLTINPSDIGTTSDIKAEDVKREAEIVEAESPTMTPRKRRVVNEAERRWRDKAIAHRYLDRMQGCDQKEKTGTSIYDDPSTWDYDSPQLAAELEKAALEASQGHPVETATPEMLPSELFLPAIKPALKYKPRLPKHQRGRRETHKKGFGQLDGADEPGKTLMAAGEPPAEGAGLDDVSALKSALEESAITIRDETDDDSDYVYDVFIRRPVHEIVEDTRFAHFQNGNWSTEHAKVPTDIGVVVISDKDVRYWDALAEEEDEDKDWDTEDEDSNAEDNPANEYPDEDLELEDEFDDANAAYSKYRCYGSDDEQFDVNDEVDYGFKPCTDSSSAEE